MLKQLACNTPQFHGSFLLRYVIDKQNIGKHQNKDEMDQVPVIKNLKKSS